MIWGAGLGEEEEDERTRDGEAIGDKETPGVTEGGKDMGIIDTDDCRVQGWRWGTQSEGGGSTDIRGC